MATAGADRRYIIDDGYSEQEVHVVRESLDGVGWTESVEGPHAARWDSSVPEGEVFGSLDPRCAYNHLPGIEAFGLKSHLHDNIFAARRWSGDATPGLHSRAYTMPADREAWLEDRRTNPDVVWIRKPTGSSRGRGIELVRRIEDVPNEPGWMVQQYIGAPHLLDGYKYVLRMYVLITSLRPLVVYIHSNGVCKRTSRPYTLDPEMHSDRYVHLTNPPVQKGNAEVEWGSMNSDLDQYFERLASEGIDADGLRHRIHDAVTKVALACSEEARLLSGHIPGDHSHCYELLGFDILIDEELNPWVLECNLGPVMSVGAEYDEAAARLVRAAKNTVSRDVLSVLGLTGAQRPSPTESWEERLDREAADSRGFTRLWPRADASAFLPWIVLPRPNEVESLAASGFNEARAEWARPRPKNDAVAFALDQGAALFDEVSQRFYWLNDTAAYVWAGLGDGLDPARIADEWSQNGGPEPGRALQTVWDLVVAWAHRGLIQGLGHFGAGTPTATSVASDGSAGIHQSVVGQTIVVDLRSSAEANTTPVALADVAGDRLLILSDGAYAAVHACSTEAVLDRLFDRRFRSARFDPRAAERLLRWADVIDAFELTGADEDPQHASLFCLATGNFVA